MEFLQKIIESKKAEVELLKQQSRVIIRESNIKRNDQRSFIGAIKNQYPALIAEIKKASPSKGLLRADFDHIQIAKAYAQAGATCISVLTDETYFQGNIGYLSDVKKTQSLPVLRKDFIIDTIQIHQAYQNGADAILLIAEILDGKQIRDFTQLAYELNMSVLLEMHSYRELHKMDFSLNKLIGINNRDLSTFRVDLNTTKQIASQLPDDVLIIGESGINSRADLDYLVQSGVHGVLVGEYFMRRENIEEAVFELIGKFVKEINTDEN